MGDNPTILCGLTCDCPELPTGGRVCKMQRPSNVRRDAHDALGTEALRDRINELISRPVETMDPGEDTYAVIVRVVRESGKHLFIDTANGVGIDEARARAVEAGTSGVFDDLMYYPPGRVTSVRLSREA